MIDVWHLLPSDTRTSILAIVEVAQGREPPDPNHAPTPRSRRDSGYCGGPSTTASHKALQKALQQPAVLPRTGSQPVATAQEKTPVLQGSASECNVVRVAGVPPQGLEPSDVTSSENTDLRQTPNQRAAKSAAVGDDLPPIDPELASVIGAWPTLPPAIREAILAMLRAAK